MIQVVSRQRLLFMCTTTVVLMLVAVNASRAIRRNMAHAALSNAALNKQSISNAAIPAADYYLEGIVAFYAKEYGAAIELLSLDTTERTDLRRWFLLQSYLETHDRIAIEAMLNEIRSLEDSRNFPYFKLLIDHRTALPDTLQQRLMEQVTRNPKLVVSYVSNLMTQEKRFADGIEILLALPNFEEQTSARLLVGRAYYFQRDYGNALQVLGDLAAESPQPAALYWYGKTLLNTGQLTQAISVFERVLFGTGAEAMQENIVPDLIAAYVRAGDCQSARALMEQYAYSGAQMQRSVDELSIKCDPS